MSRSMSAVLHPRLRIRPRTLTTALMAMWAFGRRKELAAWGRFLAGAPQRVRDGGASDVVAEARLRFKLSADPATRTLHDLVVKGGVAQIEVRDEHLPVALASVHARNVGIREVRIGPPATFAAAAGEPDRVA
jgi:hypothetical protein